ncbi:histidinol phosphatase [Plantibacter sp. Leaf171]|nr:histidinol phosphatase [Plantibacter sp. Leaf1]KQQ53245.1 histidinol phosphatase [Plantibacter sp. Leaf314]KQR60061.1 histidinol phosphatase [Plantibacter sp. Leaf171]
MRSARPYPGLVTDHSPASSADLELALRLADAADRIAMDRFEARDLEISTKPDRSHVTDADLAVERAIRGILETERPDDGVFGEEYGAQGPTDRQWIIDPIDGTANFLRGVPNWATLISLAVDGVPVVGVVSAPAMHARWWGAIGHGAWGLRFGEVEPRRLAVSAVADLADASFSFQSIAQWASVGRIPQLLALCGSLWRDRAIGDMWPYMLLAEGSIDAVAEFGVQEYDLGAHVPIVLEAGGRFTDIDGNRSISTRSSLATNGRLHDAFLAELPPVD